MAGFEISGPLLLGGGLLLVGFFIFIILYILIRLLFERHEHLNHKIDEEDKKGDNMRKIQ